METMNRAGRHCGGARGDCAGLPRCRPRSVKRDAGGGIEDLRRRGDRAGHRRRAARVRGEPRAGGQGQMAAADRAPQRAPSKASNCTSSARCNRTRPGRRWRCSMPSIRSIGQASPRRWPRRSPSRAAGPCCSLEINTGAEPQKAGVLPQEADGFLAACRDRYGLANFGADVHPAAATKHRRRISR